MDSAARELILKLLDSHRIMTVATNRPDGWPQATTVGYANDGLTLYFFCAVNSQKAANIARDERISLTIDSDTLDPKAIRGLSRRPALLWSRIGRRSRASSICSCTNIRNTKPCRPT